MEISFLSRATRRSSWAGWAGVSAALLLSGCGSQVSHGRKGVTGGAENGGSSSATGGAGGAPTFNFGGGGLGVFDNSLCGNSVVETHETCDDGNKTPGDGCSDVCRVEPGYSCATP